MTTGTLIAFLAFFFGFSFLVFIHELGHFVVARWVGIKCTQFAVGMGHAICSWRKGIGFRAGGTEAEYERRVNRRLADRGVQPREVNGEIRHDRADIDRAAQELGLGDTEYRLNWLPLGGYVKMLGQEDMDPAARSDDPRSFNSKSVGARMAVISAGVVMNLVFGMFLLTAAFSVGVKFPTAGVGEVADRSPAWSTYAQGHEGDPAFRGIRPGDTLVSLNGEPIKDFLDVKLGVALSRPGTTLDLAVKRDGVDEALHFPLRPVAGGDGLLSIGIAPTYALDNALVIDPDAPDGKELTMRLASVDGEPVASYEQYHARVIADPLRTRTLSFVNDKDGRTVDKTLTPRPVLQTTGADDPLGPRAHLLGLRPAVRVSGFVKHSPAEKAGMREGDLIARLGSRDWPASEELPRLVRDAKGQTLELSVLRDGEVVTLEPVTVSRKGQIGVLYGPALDEPIVADVVADSPAAALKLPAGSRLTAIDGKPVSNWSQMQAAVAAADSDRLTIGVVANLAGEPAESATIELAAQTLDDVRFAGWVLPQDGFALAVLERPLKADGLLDAAGLGLTRTNDFMMQAYLTIARLVQGSVQPKHLAGPVGIVHAGTKFTERGLPYLLFFLGLLSINLAVINFLPIPLVDGGHAVFLIIEKLKGSPVSVAVQSAATYVGLAFLALVFLVVTYNDILRLLPG